MIQNLTFFNAHPFSEITAMIFDESNKVVTLGLDFHMRLWNADKLIFEGEHYFDQSYLMSLCSDGNELFVGNGDGELIVLDKKDSCKQVAKFQSHSDCITDILIEYNTIIASSYDGSVSFNDRRMMKQFKIIQVPTLCSQVVRFKDDLYVAGLTAYRINSQYEVNSLKKRISYFAKTEDELYGTNDEKGMFCLSNQFNTQVPCERMVPHCNNIIGTSWQTLTYFVTRECQNISYRKGDSITNLIVQNNRILAAAESGHIYAWKMNFDYNLF